MFFFLDDVDMSFNFRLKTIQNKGEEYFSVDKMTMKMFVDKAKIKLTSLNPANQPQGRYSLSEKRDFTYTIPYFFS